MPSDECDEYPNPANLRLVIFECDCGVKKQKWIYLSAIPRARKEFKQAHWIDNGHISKVHVDPCARKEQR